MKRREMRLYTRIIPGPSRILEDILSNADNTIISWPDYTPQPYAWPLSYTTSGTATTPHTLAVYGDKFSKQEERILIITSTGGGNATDKDGIAIYFFRAMPTAIKVLPARTLQVASWRASDS